MILERKEGKGRERKKEKERVTARAREREIGCLLYVPQPGIKPST